MSIQIFISVQHFDRVEIEAETEQLLIKAKVMKFGHVKTTGTNRKHEYIIFQIN